MEFDFKKIDEARKILGLGEKATLKEIKNAYREKQRNIIQILPTRHVRNATML